MKVRSIGLAVLASPVFLLLSGCALVLHGKHQTVSVTSVPPGANVMLAGVHVAQTPGSVQLRRGDHVTLRFEKEGFKPVDVVLHRDLSGAFWGNLLLGGVIGIVVDFGTGAAYTQTPKQVTTTLDEMKVSKDAGIGVPSKQPKDTITVVFSERVNGEPVGEKLPTP